MTPSQLKKMLNDRRMSALIDALWREYPGLINEKYDRDPNKWKLNVFKSLADFGVAIGMDNSINGDQSTAIGIGLITRAFRELIIGSYNVVSPLTEPAETSAENWNAFDLLFAIGNGADADHRSNALEIFKSGLIELANALKIGAFPEVEGLQPNAGTLQYTPEGGVEFWEEGKWNKATDKDYRHTQTNPSRVWEVYHNLDKYPSVSIYDSNGDPCIAEVRPIDKNVLVINFSAPFTGYADVN